MVQSWWSCLSDLMKQWKRNQVKETALQDALSVMETYFLHDVVNTILVCNLAWARRLKVLLLTDDEIPSAGASPQQTKELQTSCREHIRLPFSNLLIYYLLMENQQQVCSWTGWCSSSISRGGQQVRAAKGNTGVVLTSYPLASIHLHPSLGILLPGPP